jgi:hypothetical protein
VLFYQQNNWVSYSLFSGIRDTVMAVGISVDLCTQNSKCTQCIILNLYLKLYIIMSVSV